MGSTLYLAMALCLLLTIIYLLPSYQEQITIERYVSTSPIVYGVTIENSLKDSVMKKINTLLGW